MNTVLEKVLKIVSENILLNRWISFQKKKKKNVRNNSDIKLIIADSRRNYLVSEANHHARKRFWDDVFSNRNEKKTPANTHVPKTNLVRSIDNRNDKNSNVWVFVQLCKNKICKIMLIAYR